MAESENLPEEVKEKVDGEGNISDEKAKQSDNPKSETNEEGCTKESNLTAKEMNLAATRIQATFRGSKLRRERKEQQEAAIKIQATFRGQRQRMKFNNEMHKRNEAAVKIQASFRGRQLRSKQEVDDEVKELCKRINEEENLNKETEVCHLSLIQQVSNAVDSMVDNVDFGATIEPRYGVGLDSTEDVYRSHLDEFIEKQNEYTEFEEESSSKIKILSGKFEVELRIAIELRDKFKQFRRVMMAEAIDSRTNKKIPAKWILQMEQEEEDIDNEIEQARLTNINLNAKQKRIENAIKEKEKLGDGLHFIDFEQLKIENQTLGEKIEERNGELDKLKSKTNRTVQILTHVKEKLQFIKRKNKNLRKNKLAEIERIVSDERDELTELKKERDKIRIIYQKAKIKQGIAGSDALVADFEKRKDKIPKLEEKLKKLQDEHRMLVTRRAQYTTQAKNLAASLGRTNPKKNTETFTGFL